MLALLGAQAQLVKGPSSSQTPYQNITATGVQIKSILTAGDVVSGYKMVGLPDGAGAFDNGDGTFTMLVNHEIGNLGGAVRAHGSAGTFVSKWVIRKSDLTVLSGGDLIQRVHLWDPVGMTYNVYYPANPYTPTLGRFCSADLAAPTAYFNSKSGKGTNARIFLNGEETGSEGRGFAHIASGPAAGNTYELPYLGKFSWENSVANPRESDTTIVVGTDDATPGQVYVYVGLKGTTGTDIDKAGLNGGKLYGIAVNGMVAESNSSVPTAGTAFTLVDLGTVHNITGSTLNTNSNTAGVTNFLRPEDGAWDPANPNDFYFVTTNSFSANSRLWRLRFTDISNPAAGGTITALIEGTEGPKMMDNMGIDKFGHILIQEDVGNNAHIGKTWQYDIATDGLKEIMQHDTARFLSGGSKYLTQDEEASGIFDAQEILGAGWWLGTDQAHYSISGEVVEGGQLFAVYNPDSYNSNPEIAVAGNGNNIDNGKSTPSSNDNTDFGNIAVNGTITKTFTINNTGAAALKVSGINITGANASEFTLVSAPTFPLTIASTASQTITVQFKPTAVGLRSAKINIVSNDFDESAFNYSVLGVGLPTTGINNLEAANFAKLYPNPTSNNVTVALTLKKEEKVSVSVLDMNGRVVVAATEQTMAAGEQQININTADLANGAYFVQIAAGNVSTKMRLVVMH